jgi:hypothetical protein
LQEQRMLAVHALLRRRIVAANRVACTAEWLKPVHLVESQRIWLMANGGRSGWAESLRLAKLSDTSAHRVWQLPPFQDAGLLAKFFTDGWRLDYRSPLVR